MKIRIKIRTTRTNKKKNLTNISGIIFLLVKNIKSHKNVVIKYLKNQNLIQICKI